MEYFFVNNLKLINKKAYVIEILCIDLILVKIYLPAKLKTGLIVKYVEKKLLKLQGLYQKAGS